MEIARSVWTSLRSLSGPLISAAAIAATLPRDCQLASSQTVHICAGWAPPFELTPGLGPFSVCWIWFGLGVVVGILLLVFVLLVIFLVILVRKFLWPQRARAVAEPEDVVNVPPGLGQRLGLEQEGLVRADLVVRNTNQLTDDTRVELLQLLVHGGHELLNDMAVQRGHAVRATPSRIELTFSLFQKLTASWPYVNLLTK